MRNIGPSLKNIPEQHINRVIVQWVIEWLTSPLYIFFFFPSSSSAGRRTQYATILSSNLITSLLINNFLKCAIFHKRDRKMINTAAGDNVVQNNFQTWICFERFNFKWLFSRVFSEINEINLFLLDFYGNFVPDVHLRNGRLHKLLLLGHSHVR